MQKSGHYQTSPGILLPDMVSLLQKHIKLIEGVQRPATKLVTDMKELYYNDRLKQLGLQ